MSPQDWHLRPKAILGNPYSLTLHQMKWSWQRMLNRYANNSLLKGDSPIIDKHGQNVAIHSLANNKLRKQLRCEDGTNEAKEITPIHWATPHKCFRFLLKLYTETENIKFNTPQKEPKQIWMNKSMKILTKYSHFILYYVWTTQ